MELWEVADQKTPNRDDIDNYPVRLTTSASFLFFFRKLSATFEVFIVIRWANFQAAHIDQCICGQETCRSALSLLSINMLDTLEGGEKSCSIFRMLTTLIQIQLFIYHIVPVAQTSEMAQVDDP